MATEAQKKAVAKYDAANTKQIHLKLNRKTDADILEQLEKQESVQGYIKQLIREDIIAGVEHSWYKEDEKKNG